jgi:hypothetical protein
MKTLLLASVATLSVLSTSVAYTADESDPPRPRFQPWQQVWQCNDIRVTVTGREPFSVEYDLGGTIWGGSRFTVVKGELVQWSAMPAIATSDLLRLAEHLQWAAKHNALSEVAAFLRGLREDVWRRAACSGPQILSREHSPQRLTAWLG